MRRAEEQLIIKVYTSYYIVSHKRLFVPRGRVRDMKVETCRNPRKSGEARAYLVLQTIEACLARTPRAATSEFATSKIGLRPFPTFASLGCGTHRRSKSAQVPHRCILSAYIGVHRTLAIFWFS